MITINPFLSAWKYRFWVATACSWTTNSYKPWRSSQLCVEEELKFEIKIQIKHWFWGVMKR